MTELIKRDGEVIDAITVSDAAAQCGQVREFIERQGLAVALNPKQPQQKYVMCEGWQAAGSALGCTAIIKSIEADAQGNVVCICDIERGGQRVGSGVGIVGVEETKFRRLSDRYGMAQTRSISRAYRNCLSWVIRDLGYMTTPAEEMPDDGHPEPTVPTPAARTAPAADQTQKLFRTLQDLIGSCGDAAELLKIQDAIKKHISRGEILEVQAADLRKSFGEKRAELLF